jgi:hypothetical protein
VPYTIFGLPASQADKELTFHISASWPRRVILAAMFSPGSSSPPKSPPAGARMTQNESTQTITCRGCGQVGALAIDPRDGLSGRQRRHGFYLHERNGAHHVACCKCQQIQPFEPAAK